MYHGSYPEEQLRAGYEALRLDRQAAMPDSRPPCFPEAMRDPLWCRLVHLHTAMLARGIEPRPLPGIPFDPKRAAAGERAED